MWDEVNIKELLKDLKNFESSYSANAVSYEEQVAFRKILYEQPMANLRHNPETNRIETVDRYWF